ncbi:adhesion G-protein coupled receptor D2 [Cebus imitator]|uniref:adhesion G-protein coupled receptor D2 n=1 Tax=Cebus imitator TaxID=2715852 RepID=UPI00189ACEE6|nr:adhesion G-protein coupled receptor D2 [Cebus imitator]
MALWCYCLLCLLIRSLSGTPSNSPGESRSPWAPAPVAPGEVVETAGGVCKFSAQRLSWWQAQESCEQQFGHLALQPPDGVLVSRLRDPVWMGQREAPLRRPPQRRTHTTAALVFGQRTADRAARLRSPLPELAALTACAHLQWDCDSPDAAALFSVAAPALPNALQLRAFAEPGGVVRAALVVRGHHGPFLAVFRADRRWHHDQDSLGGGFSARDAFSGNLTDFHLWARVLSPAQLHRARACAPPHEGLLFRWDPGALDVAPSLLPTVWSLGLDPPLVNQATPSSGHALSGPAGLRSQHQLGPSCLGLYVRPLAALPQPRAGHMPSEECPTWNPGPRTEGSELCLEPQPFLCCYRTETYRRLQDAQSWPGQDVISQVNALANDIVLFPDPLSEARGALSLAEASSFLGLLEHVLVMEVSSLGPAALLAVVCFLKRVAAIGAGEPELLLTGPWEQLGQGVVSVASLVLEEQVADTWLSIREVVGGPMALVASVQQLALLLSTTMTSERPRVRIQHRHADLLWASRCNSLSRNGGLLGLWQEETDADPASWACSAERPPSEVQPQPHLPPGLEPGLSGVTVIHSWFTSRVFQQTLWGLGLEPQAPASSEKANRVQRFLSTQVGSAIISSEVWVETGEVSMAVNFHLQHQAQAFRQKLVEPVCAFWNFSISPYTGGAWATTGCSVAALYRDSTACFCNHSTSFAILLQVYDVQRGPEEESLLRTLSFVGCGVSFCALTTTFLLFLVAGVPKSERTTVHKNLTFSLASAEGFLMASEWARGNEVACVAVTIAMHFLFLVAFSWMLVEGLLLWSKVVAVSMRPGPRMWLYHATGWGVPVGIVAATLATQPHDYVAPGHCWLSVHTDAIWAFVGPVLFVLTANTCILVRVVMVTVSSARRRARMLSPQPCLQQQIRTQIWATMKPVLVLLPVLGLTWLVGILVHLSPAWAYAAVGLNSVQGPYIFLVYGACNEEVQSALQRMAEKKSCASPASRGTSLRPPGPWEADRGSPGALAPPRRHMALRGTYGPRNPSAFSSIANPERQAVELTAFKASGTVPTSGGPLFPFWDCTRMEVI